MFQKIFFSSLFFFVFIALLVFTPTVLAAKSAAPGIAPDSPFYFLDTFAEKIGLALAFNSTNKINKAKNYAAEKSAELAQMLQKNNEQGQIKAGQNYQKMIKVVLNKMDKVAEKNPDFKNTFIPKMMAVINGYNETLRAQNPEKAKKLGEIAEKENNLFIDIYEAPRQSFVAWNLTPPARKEKLCETAFTRPIKDEVTKIFEALCGPDFAIITDDNKEKQEAVYKTVFDAAARDDISDQTKGLVQQIALSSLPSIIYTTSPELPASAAPSEFKNTKSRQIVCDFSCNSYKCPSGQKAEERFEHKSRRIFDPWDWGGASLIDRLLLSLKLADAPSSAPALSFAVSEGSCVDSDKREWNGSGIIDTDKLASEGAFNEDAFLNNFQSAFEEARRNCPSKGNDSYTFTVMCSINDFVEGKRYSEQYGEISEKCSASEAEAAQIEKTNVHNETWTYVASQHKTENVEGVNKVLIAITPGEINQPVEFNAQTKEIKANGILTPDNYDYALKFVLKTGREVSPQGSRGQFTLRRCSKTSLDCGKIHDKIIFNPEYSDEFNCGDGVYKEELLDTGVDIFGFVSKLPSTRATKEIFNTDLKNQRPGELTPWGEASPTMKKIKIGDESFLFTVSDNQFFHRGFIEVKIGRCIIALYGSASPSNIASNALWWKYHQPTFEEMDAGIDEVNRHPDFDHGKQRLEDILMEFAQEIINIVKDRCGD